MNNPNDDLRQQVALFRYGVIADLVHLEPGTPGITRRLHEKAREDYTIPGSRRTRVAVETLRHWLKLYRKDGFDALLPKPRNDRGRPRRLPDVVAELLVSTKEQHPKLPVRLVIERARQSGQIPQDLKLPHSTVHRLLSREGLMVKKTDAPFGADRRRFAFEHAGELWMSDVMHGPSVLHEKARRRKTYLIAFIDDATRVIPYAAFAFAENTAAFLPVFKQALIRRGIPHRLYVDNGANYRSRHLSLVCAKLGIALIHARPHQPQGKGKIERWFRTVRATFLTQLNDADTQRLDALNRRLWAFVEGEYHQTPHRGLDGKTPLEQWALKGDEVHFVERSLDLDDLFLFEVKRRVLKDRTVSLKARIYEVDAVLVGETVTLRFDPTASPSRPIEVVHDGKHVGNATLLDAYANSFVRRAPPSFNDKGTAEPPPSSITMRDLDDGEHS